MVKTLEENWLTPVEAARVIGISTRQVCKLVDTGKLEGIRTPLGRLIRRESAERRAEERPGDIANLRQRRKSETATVVEANVVLRELRKSTGLTMEALAVAAGISSATISRVELYGYKPGPHIKKRIAAALGVEEEQIWPGL